VPRRGVGLSQGQVSWQTSLAAFASIRLLTVLPVTPGGLGITDLGLTGILLAGSHALSSGASHQTVARVTAAVLLYRAVTYVSGHAKIPVDGHDGSRLTDS
jgi:putative heme transporter